MAFEPDLLGIENKPESAPEVVDVPEARESTIESPEGVQELQELREQEAKEQQALKEAQELAPASVQPVVIQKDPILADVENILADGLGDIYAGLPENKKAAFKAEGENVSITIQQMITSGKVKARRVLDLIRDWLKLVPGINRFFLEQEAKIKTDRVMDYAEELVGTSENQL